MEYPRRLSFFSNRFADVFHSSGAIDELGSTAALLLWVVSSAEDKTRYHGPVKFWDSDLKQKVGLSSQRRFAAVRKLLVDAGWLVYYRSTQRAIGSYWVVIPQRFQEPIDFEPTAETIEANGAENCANEFENGAQKRANGANGALNGALNGAEKCAPSIPTPTPNTSLSKKESEREREAQPSKAHPPAEAIDLELAQQFFSDLRKLDEHRAEPDFETWAHEFEQLRKAGKPIAQIREVMDFVAGHVKHWRTRIESPQSLRENWDKLALECGAAKKARAATCSEIPDLTDDDVIKPPQHRGRRLYGNRQLPSMAGANYDPDAHLKDPDHGTF
ncbi:hypothetical protein Psta_1145 [Pirellula staleyi DSM 6068]|uniref:Uncharacterized protein n=1 Tax=Pirellula staleyi (strain ATCC 27377 / DSM 6068 / ICPB 4128) TaxID=530564 RepID=D2R900_PIRSD|nr:hypothetical protein [Pirellula staleyi]ADB15827.1 hypothetical protein Psta_1145 [Pirellula staleyi DSM 6068]